MSVRWTGCLPRESKPGDGTFRVVPDDWLIPEKDWKTYHANNLIPYVWHVINQGRQNSCCACAGAGIVMLARERQGLDRVLLSQAVPYHFGNGGRDGGMAIDTCLRELLKHGTCPADVVDPYDWRRSHWPSEWEEIGELYKPFEWMDCPTYEHAGSMLAHGHPVIYGAMGHAVVRVANGMFTDTPDLNSWPDWQEKGLGRWATEREFRRGIEGGYGAWALRYAVDPPNDGDLLWKTTHKKPEPLGSAR